MEVHAVRRKKSMMNLASIMLVCVVRKTEKTITYIGNMVMKDRIPTMRPTRDSLSGAATGQTSTSPTRRPVFMIV